jgi:hypothetical protein
LKKRCFYAIFGAIGGYPADGLTYPLEEDVTLAARRTIDPDEGVIDSDVG